MCKNKGDYFSPKEKLEIKQEAKRISVLLMKDEACHNFIMKETEKERRFSFKEKIVPLIAKVTETNLNVELVSEGPVNVPFIKKQNADEVLCFNVDGFKHQSSSEMISNVVAFASYIKQENDKEQKQFFDKMTEHFGKDDSLFPINPLKMRGYFLAEDILSSLTQLKKDERLKSSSLTADTNGKNVLSSLALSGKINHSKD